MPPRIRAVEEAANKVLKEAGVDRLPVPIDKIARRLAFVMHDKLPDDVSGMLVPTAPESSKRWIIIANRIHPVQRQRFTIAHELGHLLLHEYKTAHADGPQKIRFRDGKSSMGTDREEIEANQFAAEVLMPDYLMIPELRKLGLDSWDVSQAGAVAEQLTDLAAQCKVSEQALVLRIGTLVG
jgi:hypothetical protein